MILCRGSQKGECIMFFNKKSRTERFMEGFGNFCDALAEAGNQYLEEKRRAEERARKERALREAGNLLASICEDIFTENRRRESYRGRKYFRTFSRIVDTNPKGIYKSIISDLVRDYVDSGDPEFLIEAAKRLNTFTCLGVTKSSKLERAFKDALSGSGNDWRIYSSLSDRFKLSINGRTITFYYDRSYQIYRIEAC